MKRKITVVTAQPLAGYLRVRVEEMFRRRYPNGTTLEYVVDEELLGGIVIFDGQKLYDGSVRRRLAQIGGTLQYD